MKRAIIFLAIVSAFQPVLAQSIADGLKISLKDKRDKFIKVEILSGSVNVTGYDGNELIIETTDSEVKKTTGEVSGLQNITLLSDKIPPLPAGNPNPQITESEKMISVIMPLLQHKDYLIKVPRNTHFSIYAVSLSSYSKLSIKNLTGELEIKTYAILTEVTNVSGPFTLIAYGTNSSKQIKISHINWLDMLAANPNSKIFIAANCGNIDLSLPDRLKATITVRASNGQFYSDLKLVPGKLDPNEKDAFLGNLNGGGLPLYINSSNTNVFVRSEQ